MTSTPVVTDPTAETHATSERAPMLTALQDRLRRLAEVRRDYAQAKTNLVEAQKAFEANHASTIAMVATLGTKLEAEDAAVREIAAAHYRATQEKQPTPGVTVKVTTVLQYDEVLALGWARENGAALKLDRAGFDQIAKALPLPFVTRSEAPAVSIARDLDAVLGVG